MIHAAKMYRSWNYRGGYFLARCVGVRCGRRGNGKVALTRRDFANDARILTGRAEPLLAEPIAPNEPARYACIRANRCKSL